MELVNWILLGWLILGVLAAIAFGLAVRGMRHDDPRQALVPTMRSALRPRPGRLADRRVAGHLRRVR